MKQNFFDKKDLDCNYNPIYPTFFCWLLQFLLLATIKVYEQQALNTIIHFYLCFQIFFCILTITSSRYFVYMLPDKMENSTLKIQLWKFKFYSSLPKNGFRHSGFGISTQDSMCANCQSKMDNFDFFSLNLGKLPNYVR